MYLLALKMLFGDFAKLFGILMGVTLAALVITQQGAIFCGIMTRSFSIVSDMPVVDIWVMDPKVQYVDDNKPLQATERYRVSSVAGVAWAVPLYKGNLRARLDNGSFQNCIVLGLDDSSLVGGPIQMLEGELGDLRRADGVVVDVVGATGRLAKPAPAGSPPGTPGTPVKVGDTLELNDKRAIVVGICKTTRAFQNQPIVFTTYTRAMSFAPRERKLMSFVLVKAMPGQDAQELCTRITKETGLAAYTQSQFKWMSVEYFLKYTGIPINFGIAVGLGFLIGTIITGFMFYSFTLDNIRFLGTLKAMGTSNNTLTGMVLLQAVSIAVIGFGIGSGIATLFGQGTADTALAFNLIWQLLVVAGGAVITICMLAAMLSLRRVLSLEPAVVFKG